MNKNRIKRATFNLRIPQELFDGLDKCVKEHKKVGIKLTKTYVVEKYLFQYLKDLGFLDRNFIKKNFNKYSH
jgi:hypothetical protein